MTNHDPIAYIYEADTHCPECTEDRFGRTDDGYIAGENEDGELVTDNEGNPVGAVFSWEEWWQCDGTCETLSCGTCHGEIDRAHNDPHSSECDEFVAPMSYILTLTEPEHRALAWIADRYPSAAVLYGALVESDDTQVDENGWAIYPITYTIAEHKVWEYVDELPNDNGNTDSYLPPCVGGTLADKLITLIALSQGVE